jgi:predicted HD phosphohydrolase
MAHEPDPTSPADLDDPSADGIGKILPAHGRRHRDDYEVLRRVHEHNLAALPDLLLGLLGDLGAGANYPITRYEHSLQSAARAWRDARRRYVVCALLHDIGESLGPSTTARWWKRSSLRLQANHWMLTNHPVFQVYFYGTFLDLDPNARDAYRDSPHFDRTAEFCALYDEVSFDPDYDSEPITTFEPMVRRVLARSWIPPT